MGLIVCSLPCNVFNVQEVSSPLAIMHHVHTRGTQIGEIKVQVLRRMVNDRGMHEIPIVRA